MIPVTAAILALFTVDDVSSMEVLFDDNIFHDFTQEIFVGHIMSLGNSKLFLESFTGDTNSSEAFESLSGGVIYSYVIVWLGSHFFAKSTNRNWGGD